MSTSETNITMSGENLIAGAVHPAVTAFRDYANAVEENRRKIAYNALFAVDQFQTAVMLSGLAESRIDLPAALLPPILDAAAAHTIDKLNKRLERELGNLDDVPGLNLLRSCYSAVSAEVARAEAAQQQHTLRVFIHEQRAALSRTVDSDRAAIIADLERGYLGAPSSDVYLRSVGFTAEALREQDAPDIDWWECGLYERWIALHHQHIDNDDTGCIEITINGDGRSFGVGAIVVAAPAGERIAGRLNELFAAKKCSRAKPLDLRVHKRVILKVPGVMAGGITSWSGWLGDENEIVFRPDDAYASELLQGPWKSYVRKFTV